MAIEPFESAVEKRSVLRDWAANSKTGLRARKRRLFGIEKVSRLEAPVAQETVTVADVEEDEKPVQPAPTVLSHFYEHVCCRKPK